MCNVKIVLVLVLHVMTVDSKLSLKNNCNPFS